MISVKYHRNLDLLNVSKNFDLFSVVFVAVEIEFNFDQIEIQYSIYFLKTVISFCKSMAIYLLIYILIIGFYLFYFASIYIYYLYLNS
jgi:hypothetical protein